MKIIEWILSRFRNVHEYEHERLQDYVPERVIDRHKANDYRKMAIEKQEVSIKNDRLRESLHRSNALQYAQYRIIRKYIGYTDRMLKMLRENGCELKDIAEFNNEVKIKLHTKKQKKETCNCNNETR